MSSYGLIVIILAFCVGGGTAAVHGLHPGDIWVEVCEFESHLKQFFCSIIFLNAHCIVKVTNTEL